MADQAKTTLQKIVESFARDKGEFHAIGREAVKDVRNTINEIFFGGKSEHMGEPGAPLNPTQIMVTDEIRGNDVNGTEPKQETTLEKMRGYAAARSQEALQRMENGQAKEAEKQNEM